MEVKPTELEDIDALATELSKQGVVSVEGFLTESTCDDIRKRVEELVENDKLLTAEEFTGSDKMGADQTILERRSGSTDDGMLDIHNIDERIPQISNIKNDNSINEIIHKAGTDRFEPENINIYYNRSVTNTRGYHFDSYNSQFKAFVYLTDVEDDSNGPYSYIKGSNNRSYFRRRFEGLVNRLRGNNPTDAIFYDDDEIVKFTAPKGTLIISDQTGYHRGIPQEAGRTRMLISNSFTPV